VSTIRDRIADRSLLLLVMIGVIAVLVSCGTKSQTVDGIQPERLGSVGAAIDLHPDKAKAILSHNGYTMEGFRSAVRKVSEDPELSRRYHRAFKSTRQRLQQ